MGNRNIGESVRLINDILEYTNENDIEAILFSADFEKAFDLVEHSFIISPSEHLDLGRILFSGLKRFLKM